MKVIRLYLLILLKYFERNVKWVSLLLIPAIILIFIAFRFNVLVRENVLRIGLVGTFQEHDLPREVTGLLSSGLLDSAADGRVAPLLVKGWEANNDATRFKLEMKDNLTWSDGSKIKASDLDTVIPNTEITYTDNTTFQFNLKQPYSSLPSLLTKPVFKKGTLIGTGPYIVSKIEKSRIFITKIILEPMDPKLPKLHFRFYPSEKVAITGFNLGEVQVLIGVNAGELTKNPGVLLKSRTDFSKIVTILFNTAEPNLKNRSLRQAMAYQTPKIEGEEEADNPYPHKFWAYDPDAKKYLANSKEAEEAMVRAKSSLSPDKFTFELIMTTTPNLEKVGEKIVASWKQLGLNAKLRVESGIPQNFQSLLITQSIPNDPDQYFLWHATQTKTNLSKYDSKRVDKDLEDGRKTISEEDRKAIYYDFQKALLEDAPAVFLYFPKYNIIYLKKVETLLNKILNLQVY